MAHSGLSAARGSSGPDLAAKRKSSVRVQRKPGGQSFPCSFRIETRLGERKQIQTLARYEGHGLGSGTFRCISAQAAASADAALVR